MADSFTFKKRTIKNRGGARKRKGSSEKESSEDDAQNVVKAVNKIRKPNPNFQTTERFKVKSKAAVGDDLSDSSEGEGVSVSYKSARDSGPSGPQDQGATSIVEIDTELDRDAQAIFEKSLEINKELEGKEDDKIYRGLNNYAQYYKKRDTAAGNASSGMVRKGPIRAPAHLRATVRWDYQPDICKDYKETGFCGFGDSCKFLHDRGDYKHGWQLERETEGGQSTADDDGKWEIHEDEADLPFKCYICRESFTDPIVTKCKHYFCEKCALANFKKSTKCYNCNVQTDGVFKPAVEIINRMKEAEENNEEQNNESESD